MDRFDWQTEEDGPIAPEDSTPATVATAPGRRWALTAVFVMIALAAVVTFVIWQLGRQANMRDEVVQGDVAAAFGVWTNAIDRQDDDLLNTLLMGGDADWTAVQRQLLANGRSLDRPGIGLYLTAERLDGLDPHFDISRDWRAAEISFPLPYDVRREGEPDAPITLQQTVFLHREGSRWLLKRPETDFWGIWRTSTGEIASLTYRERDAGLARQLLVDLDRDLMKVCAAALAQGGCPAETTVQVRLESDATTLLKVSDPFTPAFSGRVFVLPTPTLAGKPVDAAGYQALYAAYSHPIVTTFEASLGAPLRLPGQVVALLCVDRHGRVPHLFTFDPAGTSPGVNSWSNPLDAGSFRFLAADAGDDGLVLRQHMPGEPTRFKVVYWAGGLPAVLHDQTYGPMTGYGVGWTGAAGDDGLLLSTYQGTMRAPSYWLIKLNDDGSDQCPAGGCLPQALDGFPVWSVDGQNSLVVDGIYIFLADKNGRAQVDLGEGHSPFWLDEFRFGFVRPSPGGDRQLQEVVIGSIQAPELQAIWRTDEFDLASIGAPSDAPFYLQHVTPLPGPARLLLYGRQYAGDRSKYAYLSLPVPPSAGSVAESPPVRIELVLDESPAGFPSAADPNGHLPYVLSPDGRWLAAAHSSQQGANVWQIETVEIGRDRALHFHTGYPGYSFDHPFLDWSADGRWLMIVDKEFLLLVAPEAGFERIISHDKRSCSYAAWIDRPPPEKNIRLRQ